MKIQLQTYPIHIQKGILNHIYQLIPSYNKVAIIYDSGIPAQWINQICSQFQNSIYIGIPYGEKSKSLTQYERCIRILIENNFSRKDAILAFGGGVVGDLAGFVAATYMRGIDFYNIPTTILSQVDSSVGGKVAINMDHYKNMVGAFYRPKAVYIDPEVLTTLSSRQKNNGLIEALKMGLILDAELFSWFEQDELPIEQIICRSIELKKQIVEQDEKESGIRAILNFGHTVGHAIEAKYPYYHGECVSMGMLYFIEDRDLKKRVLAIYDRLNMPRIPDFSIEEIIDGILHDKKNNNNGITCVIVPALGQHTLQTLSIDQIETRLKGDPYEE